MENPKMELGGRICVAVGRMMKASIIDEKIFDLCLKEIALALFQTDLQFNLVIDLQFNVKNRVKGNCSAPSYDRQIVLQVIFDEVCKVLDPGKPSFSPVKRERRVVMFVGLQGAGKTTACAQFAHYYKKQGWLTTAIVSADTFRASNFDQLMQNTMESNISLYGSFMASDPVANIACKGVELCKLHDLIILDTSERHTKESTLIEETCKLYEATKPDVVIFVVKNGTGQAALLHQLKQSVDVGGVIVTGFNSDAKGGGEALSSIAATKTPVLFLSRGERLEEFEVFSITHFVSHHLGLGEMLGFKEDVAMDQQPEVLQEYPLRTTYKLIYQMPEALPGLAKGYRRQWLEAKKRTRDCHLAILGSMKDEELDGCVKNLLNCPCIMKISKQSNLSVQ